MTRSIKLFISLIYFSYIKLNDILKKIFQINVPARCITLYYHSIYSEEKESFRKQMALVQRNTNPISSTFMGKFEKGKLYSIITFDDAFENLIANAIPIMNELNIPFTIFFISSYFGKTPQWEISDSHSDKNQKIMTVDQMNSLPQNLLTIGSHTVNHRKLTQLSDEDITLELNASKKSLEDLSGKEIKVLSFPNGLYNENILEKSFSAGYTRVFTIEPKFLLENNSNIVGRVWTNGDDWYPEFWLKLHGGYCWLDYFFKFRDKYLK